MSGQCSITSSRSSRVTSRSPSSSPSALARGRSRTPHRSSSWASKPRRRRSATWAGLISTPTYSKPRSASGSATAPDPAAEVERDPSPGRERLDQRHHVPVRAWRGRRAGAGAARRSASGPTGCSAMRSSEPVGRVVAVDELRHALGAFDRLRQRAVGGPLPVGVQRLPVGPGGLLGQELRRLGRQVRRCPSGGTAAGGRAPPSTARWAGARRRPPPGACRGTPGRRARGPCASRPGAASRTGRRRRSTSGTGRRRSDRPARMRSAGPSSPSLTPSSCRRWPDRRTSACSQGIWRASAAATPGSPKGWRSRSNILGSGKASGFSTQKNGPSPLRASRFEPPPEPRFCPKWS